MYVISVHVNVMGNLGSYCKRQINDTSGMFLLL